METGGRPLRVDECRAHAAVTDEPDVAQSRIVGSLRTLRADDVVCGVILRRVGGRELRIDGP